MAKIYGLFGAMSGKVADVVMSVRNGQQIVRKYQPVVKNPQTENQYTTRARFKLLSQLSAVMALVIAIPRKGGVSSRNLFTKINFKNTSFANSAATINFLDVQLTNGVVALPTPLVTREANSLTVRLGGSASLDVSRVVYCFFTKQSDEKLRASGSAVVSIAGEYSTFDYTYALIEPNANLVIYAYGIRDNNENARYIFGNLIAPTAEDVAKIIVTRSLTDADVTITETRAVLSSPTQANTSTRAKNKE